MIFILFIRIIFKFFLGPSVWPKLFPQAAGSLQSPVNIETSKSTNDTTLKCKPLYWNYCPEMCTKIINTGFGWKVDATGGKGSGKQFIFIFFLKMMLNKITDIKTVVYCLHTKIICNSWFDNLTVKFFFF